MLSGPRDAEVKLETIAALRERFGDCFPERGLAPLIEALERERRELSEGISLDGGAGPTATAALQIEAGRDAIARLDPRLRGLRADRGGAEAELPAGAQPLRRHERGPERADEDLGALGELVEQRQSELLDSATSLAEGIYAEKPKKFIARIQGYWAKWR